MIRANPTPRLLRRALCVLLTAMLITACQPTVYLMPTPVALTSGKVDPFLDNPQLQGNNRIRIAYATNRVPVGPKQHRLYSTAYDDKIRLGEASLQIGEENIPWVQLHAESTAAERPRARVIRLKKAEEMATLDEQAPLDELSPELQAYFDRLNAWIDNSLSKDLIVYVHGANNNFYRTSAQAGQFRHFTGYNAVVLVYAWPSAENLLRYDTDVANARASVPVFTRLLRLLARHSKARYINVLAYSAGAQIASPALALLREQLAGESDDSLRRKLRLGEVYFAAPDVDLEGFVNHLRSYENMTCNVTLALNFNDTVLGLAEDMHGGRSRAGRPDIDELSEEQSRWILDTTRKDHFDVIDISASELPDLSAGAHDFWYNHPWTSNDVLVQFLFHARPRQRGLLKWESPDDPSVVWYFPEDYPERVLKAIRQLYQQENVDSCGRRGKPPAMEFSNDAVRVGDKAVTE